MIGAMAHQETTKDALRAQLRSDETADRHRELQELLDRIAERSDLTDDEALKLANEELHAMRAGK